MIGGLDVYIRNSIIYTNSDFEYVIVHGNKDNNMPVIKNGKPIREYQISLYRELGARNDLRAIIQTIKIVRKERPNVIHCHSAKGGVVGRIVGFLTQTKTYYTPHAFSFLSSRTKIKRFVFLILERMVKFNSYLLACSESEREIGMSEVHYNEKHALVWTNAVPDATLLKHGIKDYICYIGRPCYQKNTSFLVDVVERVNQIHPEIKFLLLGVGFYSPELDEMKKKIEKHQLQSTITLMPWLAHKETLEYIQRSLFYLSVARYEGLPLSIIEAMSQGKAIVASNVVGNKDCIVNGHNGYLLPLQIDDFVKAICTLIEDTKKRNEFGKNSRLLFEKKFLISNRIYELEEIYKS